MTLKLQHAPPPPATFDPEVMDMTFGPQYDHVELLIYLDPTCQYQLRLKASFREMLGQVSVCVEGRGGPHYNHIERLIYIDPTCC